ncbi:ABC transporter ATP-binding protein [Microbacterium sp. NE2HP2]|uniref:dipeptide ABC transporter ATP-binding protein n=1 Tax=Microbacterium TaxID=33882 RepID=UPI0023665D28|nr:MULTISPECIES: ABC transporter ATP-binding protein [Microbacterium]MDD7943873.1 ABC transporter ATP-binding protein [Microbacterium plantarum]WHE34846.1 ABC transporter ATP-binding protein [Microbacterium sp. BDGP8]WRK15948.1 ABC transporter ATP-binding protein [Microbacterium plantarum]
MSDTTSSDATPLLDIRNLHVGFQTKAGLVPAVRGVDLTIYPRQSVAIVGESGSGKSTTAQAIIRLLPGTGRITDGQIMFEGRDLAALSNRELQAVRGAQIGYVPQDPMSNLNPVLTVGFQVREAVRSNRSATGRAAVRDRAVEVLTEAGLPDAADRMRQYPHQFSGGMRQRALIGIGLSARPKLLIADEPTSALDVTVQRQILDHLGTLTTDFGTSVLFITHDLGLAAERAEHLVVMYRGRVVESGPSQEILADPKHPYTKRLVSAAPSLASRRIQAVRHHEDVDVFGAGEQFLARAEEREAEAEAVAARSDFIDIRNARRVYKVRTGGLSSKQIVAVDDVSIQVAKGTTTAIVGESGSGKSTLAKLFLQLEQLTSGEIRFDGKKLGGLSRAEELAFRRRVQPVFQDPYGTLDPQYSVGDTIAEPMRVHKFGTQKERSARVRELLDQVSLPAAAKDRYPSELSGGQRQRVAIARALALKPDVLVLDEAVSALDVLVQGQILNLLTELQTELDLTYLFITHDLAVVRLVADNVSVMRRGRLVESATTDEVFDHSTEEYTRELLAAIPGAGFQFGV